MLRVQAESMLPADRKRVHFRAMATVSLGRTRIVPVHFPGARFLVAGPCPNSFRTGMIATEGGFFSWV